MKDPNPVLITITLKPNAGKPDPGKKTFEISEQSMAAVIAISHVISKNNLAVVPDDNLLQVMELERDAISEIIAIAIQNGHGIYQPAVKQLIIDNMDARDLLQVLNVVIKKANLPGFANVVNIMKNGTVEQQAGIAKFIAEQQIVMHNRKVFEDLIFRKAITEVQK